MKKHDVRLGGVYEAKVSGKPARVRLDAVAEYGGWIGTNLETGKAVRIHTAGRLRKEVGIAPSTSMAALWQQWQKLKDSNPGTILLFLVGDHYESLGIDAHFVGAILGLEVSTVPYESLDIHAVRFPAGELGGNIGKLVQAGHRVAVCERVRPDEVAGKPAEIVI